MKFINARAEIVKGSFRLDLSEPCNCYIGLVEFHLPNINRRANNENTIDLTCDQIDSTFDNPRRLLKRLCFEKVYEGNYNHFEARFIDFKRVDSEDKFLTFNISRTIGNKNVNFAKAVDSEMIYYTLAIKPINEASTKWKCI